MLPDCVSVGIPLVLEERSRCLSPSILPKDVAVALVGCQPEEIAVGFVTRA